MRATVVMMLLLSTTAAASPAAEKLFQDGKELLKSNKLAEACDAFRKSQELEPRVGTLLNLGDCEERRGRVATAWDAFTQARALANQKADVRAAEADKRAAALSSKLPYLTIRVVQPVAALVVTRDGKAVAAAELDHEVPIDPGRYELEARAPGHVAWKQTAVVAVGQKAVIEIPALAADPTVATAPTDVAPARPANLPPAVDVVASARRLPAKHRIGFGVAAGFSTDSDLIYGLRIPVRLAPIGNGALRAVPTLFYTKFDDPADVYHEIKLYAAGLALEYLAPLAPTFYIAAGAGFGMDFLDDNYGNEIQNQAWGALRLSPTLRLGSAVDIGLHIQAVATKDRVVGLGELGVDYFFY